MADWTTARVQDRLELAANVFRQLPAVKPTGYFNAWPEYFHSFADQVGQEPQMRYPRPGPGQITEVEEALLWLRWLERDDAQIVWLRAERTAWKPICWEMGLSRTAATKRWQFGLAVHMRSQGLQIWQTRARHVREDLRCWFPGSTTGSSWGPSR